MEKPWRPFTSTGRKLTRLLNAASRSRKGSSAAQELNQSPASNAGTTYTEIGIPEAIAELCLPTGDEHLDYLHVILIDLVQKGFIQAVRVPEDTHLRYIATQAGKQFVEEQLQYSVDEFLQGMTGDN